MSQTPRSPSAIGSHAKRLARNLAAPKTRDLLDHVLNLVVPLLEGQGFKRVDFELLDPQRVVSGKEVVLERGAANYIDSITLNFDKYHRPKLQVHLSRREIGSPYKFIRSTNLVHRRSQYYSFWGKPWWLPSPFWRVSSGRKTAEKLQSLLPQALQFLEQGNLGPNIGTDARE